MMALVLVSSTLLLLHLSAPSLWAGGQTAANVLKVGAGARPVGMGEAFTAVADDANTVAWNPAGLAGLRRREFSAMHLEYVQAIRYESLAYVHPLKRGALGLHLAYLHTEGIPGTEIDQDRPEGYRDTGRFGADTKTGAVAYGLMVGSRTAVGVAVRGLRTTLADVQSNTAVALDLGGLWRVGTRVTVGAAMRNLGTPLKFITASDRLPLVFQGGVAVRLLARDRLLLAQEVLVPTDHRVRFHTGAEWRPFGPLAGRAGYRYDWGGNDLGTFSGLTAGGGLRLFSYALDYAFVPFGVLGSTHRISLTGQF